jgi:hypothetical protein
VAGAENKLGQGRPFGQPVFQQFGERSAAGAPGIGSGERRESGEEGSARQFITDLIQQQRLRLPDVYEYNMMWKGLSALTIHSPIAAEVRINVPPAVHQTIVNVSRGIDFVLFHELGKSVKGRGLQGSILRELAELRQEEDIDRFILTHEEGSLLRDAAAAVNVAYDPGGEEDTPENREKRTFRFADLERGGAPAVPTKVVEATRVVPDGK